MKTKRGFFMVHAGGSQPVAEGYHELEPGEIVEWRGTIQPRESTEMDAALKVLDLHKCWHWIMPGQLTQMSDADVFNERLDPGSFDLG
jgi:hypothetical protein